MTGWAQTETLEDEGGSVNLDHCTALVTGAASGLGLATATALAERGVTVVGLDLSPAIERLGHPPSGMHCFAGDVTDEADVNNALATIDDSTPLRLVVNCAGVLPSARTVGSRGPHPLDLFRRAIDVNLIGTFNVLRLAADHMVRHTPPLPPDESRGVIVNTASIAAFESQIGQAAYAASKGGVASMTLATARDLAKYGVRVNSIAPGVMDTPMLAGVPDDLRASLFADVPHPHRLGRPEEFASLVITIAEQDYLNGETIRLDGGLRMGPR